MGRSWPTCLALTRMAFLPTLRRERHQDEKLRLRLLNIYCKVQKSSNDTCTNLAKLFWPRAEKTGRASRHGASLVLQFHSHPVRCAARFQKLGSQCPILIQMSQSDSRSLTPSCSSKAVTYATACDADLQTALAAGVGAAGFEPRAYAEGVGEECKAVLRLVSNACLLLGHKLYQACQPLGQKISMPWQRLLPLLRHCLSAGMVLEDPLAV